MLNLFEHLVFWHWLLFAALLLILELVSGSGFLFWLGLSASIVGLMVWIIPELTWVTQFLSFSVLVVITAFMWWLYLKKHPISTDRPLLNRRGSQYVGRVFVVEAAIENGIGTIRVDDTMWRVRCVDLPAGARVRIVGVDGVVLVAEPV